MPTSKIKGDTMDEVVQSTDENHQSDPTVNMSLEQKVQPNTAAATTTFDISQPVVPGHDMVINHPSGSQELANGNVAMAVAAKEAEVGHDVSPDEVEALPEAQPHRSVVDPEVNQPQLSEPDAAPESENDSPEAPEPEAPEEEPEEAAPQPTSEDVDNA
jgi:hypothetical protein